LPRPASVCHVQLHCFAVGKLLCDVRHSGVSLADEDRELCWQQRPDIRRYAMLYHGETDGNAGTATCTAPWQGVAPSLDADLAVQRQWAAP
jgi:hypothetical protein